MPPARHLDAGQDCGFRYIHRTNFLEGVRIRSIGAVGAKSILDMRSMMLHQSSNDKG